MSTFEVSGSHGTLVVNASTGEVVDGRLESGCPCGDYCYNSIILFNLAEWQQRYPGEDLESVGCVDILDLGYWMCDGRYSPPQEDWRKEFAEVKAERERQNV